MKTRRNIMQTIAGSIVLGTMFLCAIVARGAIMIINPDLEETPISVGKTIGQVTGKLMGAESGKINIYFNEEAFPKGSVNTWSKLGDRFITFVNNYKPAKLSTKYEKAVETQAKKFKDYGIAAINTLHAIRNSNVYEALLQNQVTKANITSLAKKLAQLKKNSVDVKKTLKKLESRIKKHERQNAFPAEPVSAGKKTRISLAHIEKKLRDAFIAIDVILDRMLADAEPKKFSQAVEEKIKEKAVPPQEKTAPTPVQQGKGRSAK